MEVTKIPKATQLTVSCENRPGTLAHVARVLGDAKVNIVAFSVGTSGGGDVHLVVDDPNKGKEGPWHSVQGTIQSLFKPLVRFSLELFQLLFD
jgi:UTP:GlnB (protein PII) uridylyltransferase